MSGTAGALGPPRPPYTAPPGGARVDHCKALRTPPFYWHHGCQYLSVALSCPSCSSSVREVPHRSAVCPRECVPCRTSTRPLYVVQQSQALCRNRPAHPGLSEWACRSWRMSAPIQRVPEPARVGADGKQAGSLSSTPSHGRTCYVWCSGSRRFAARAGHRCGCWPRSPSPRLPTHPRVPGPSGAGRPLRIELGYLDPASIDVSAYEGREEEGVLCVHRAGEILHGWRGSRSIAARDASRQVRGIPRERC